MLRWSRLFLAGASWRAIPERKHYDVCVLGGGPAGIAAVMRAVDYKKKVCLIEKGPLGGMDLWDGALQSKTMWEFAVFLEKLRGEPARRLFGSSIVEDLAVDQEAMRESMRRVSETRERQIRQALAATDVDILVGQATFQSDDEVQCHNHEEMTYQNVTADYFVVATGSTPREHPFVSVDGKLVVTPREIMRDPLPRSLVIIGAGVTGCEFASILAGLGKTKVALIDKAPRILMREDEDIVGQVERQLEKSGVLIHHESTLYDLQAWEETPEEARQQHPEDPDTCRSGVQYTIMSRHTKELTTFNVDKALIAVGRVPNYYNLGLENTSLRTNDGRLSVNSVGLCKNSKNVFAVGDAASDMMIVSLGEAQAKLAVDYMYGTRRRDTIVSDAAALPSTISTVAFLTRAVAAVGLNEQECRKRNIAYICCRYGFDLVSRAVAAANTDGFIKILVTNDSEMRVLGVRASGFNSSTLVDLGSLAIQNRQSAFDLAERLTAYPSVSQAFQECLRAILGRSELKPGTFPSMVITKWGPNDFERGIAYQEEVKEEMLKRGVSAEDADGETACIVERKEISRPEKHTQPPAAASASSAASAPAAASTPASTASSSSSAAEASAGSDASTPTSTPSAPAAAAAADSAKAAEEAVDATAATPGFFFQAPKRKL